MFPDWFSGLRAYAFALVVARAIDLCRLAFTTYITAHFDRFAESTHNAHRRQAGVDLDPERLAVIVIEHVTDVKPASIP